MRLEVHETDGAVFTDLIHARTPTPPPPDEGLAPTPESRRSRRSKKRQTPVLVEVTADGFVPGEDIAVALILTHTAATSTGSARALVDTTHPTPAPSETTAEVVLYGRVSGTTHVRRLP